MEKLSTRDEVNPVRKEAWGKLISLGTLVDNHSLFLSTYNIGSNLENDIVIRDSNVEEFHCKIHMNENAEFFITDLSEKGTFLEKEKIGKDNVKQIQSGDRFFLGNPTLMSFPDIIGFVFSAQKKSENQYKLERGSSDEKITAHSNQTPKMDSEVGEEMKCSICLDYIYQCATIIPCLHNFCSACLCDWIKDSDKCPQCRDTIIEIRRNTTFNSLIEKFLEKFPEKKRPEEEIENMNKRNCLKDDRLILSDFKAKESNSIYSSTSQSNNPIFSGGVFTYLRLQSYFNQQHNTRNKQTNSKRRKH